MHDSRTREAAEDSAAAVRETLLNWLAITMLLALGIVWPSDEAFRGEPSFTWHTATRL